jgi:hypothetical protein
MLLYRGLKNFHTAWLALIGVVSVGLLFLATSVDGTLGAFRDFQFWADVRRVLGIPHTPASPADFSLMRDVTSWILLFIITSGTLLLHRHCQHISRCLSGLAASGAIIARTPPRSNLLSKLLLVDKIASGVPPGETFGVLVGTVVDRLSRRSVWVLVSMILASLVLAELLVLGQQHGLFQVFAPHDLSPKGKRVWLADAYRNWWASKDHVFGYLIYQVLAVFGIFIVFSIQLLGVVSVYVTIGMYFLVEPRADWLNRDGHFGWAPMARAYRPVIWENVLGGAALTVVLLSLGINNYSWVAVLVIVYALLMPVFLFTPWLVLRRVEETARLARVRELDEVITSRGLDPKKDIEALAPFISELERCRAARVRPLRLGTATIYTSVVVIILPIMLAAAEIFFPLRFGHK